MLDRVDALDSVQLKSVAHRVPRKRLQLQANTREGLKYMQSLATVGSVKAYRTKH
jgi:hypothetical protein